MDVRKSVVILLLASAAGLGIACSSGPGSGETAKLTPQQARGQKLFEMNCAVCHAPGSNSPVQGPNLAGAMKKEYLPSGMPATEERISQTIVQGRRMMPGFGNSLSEDQLKDLLAYLKVK